MNKEQLQQQIEDMKNKLVEMEAELNKPEVTINYWQPKEDEIIYFVSHLGKVSTSYYNKRCQIDEIRYMVFKTQKEAERYAEYIKAEETLRRVIAEANEGWLPDWTTHIEDKWCITIEAGLYKLKETCAKSFKDYPTFMYIKSGALCNKLIKEYEKEFKTYLSY